MTNSRKPFNYVGVPTAAIGGADHPSIEHGKPGDIANHAGDIFTGDELGRVNGKIFSGRVFVARHQAVSAWLNGWTIDEGPGQNDLFVVSR